MIKIKIIKNKYLYCDICEEQIKYDPDSAGFEECQTSYGDFCDECQNTGLIGKIEFTKEQINKIKDLINPILKSEPRK